MVAAVFAVYCKQRMRRGLRRVIVLGLDVVSGGFVLRLRVPPMTEFIYSASAVNVRVYKRVFY